MAKHQSHKKQKRIVQEVAFPYASSCLTVAVVGGGASGLAAACACAATAQELGKTVRVVVLEKSRHIGAPILRSGNGRCNFSHLPLSENVYNQPQFVASVLSMLDVPAVQSENAVLDWFASLGLVWKPASNSDGLLYPYSNKATSVLDVLEAELERLNVERYCNVEVIEITQENECFQLGLRAVDKAGFLRADSIIYAAGGMLRSAGLPQGVMAALSATDLKPVLGPLRTDTQFLHKLDGIRAQVRLSCPGAQFSEEGEVLFRSYGISGIVVFNASRFVNPGEAVVLDFAPRYSHDQVVTCLLKRAKQFAARTGKQPTYADLLKGIFLAELASALISFTASGGEPIASCTPVNSAGINALAYAIKNFELHVTGVGSLDQCQVCRGGIAVSEVDAQTLEAHQIPGLFITGEALDVDAPCGGYNLHWAWATGLLAGRAAANKLAACQVALDQQASLRKAKNHLLVRCSIKKEGYKP